MAEYIFQAQVEAVSCGFRSQGMLLELRIPDVCIREGRFLKQTFAGTESHFESKIRSNIPLDLLHIEKNIKLTYIYNVSSIVSFVWKMSISRTANLSTSPQRVPKWESPSGSASEYRTAVDIEQKDNGRGKHWKKWKTKSSVKPGTSLSAVYDGQLGSVVQEGYSWHNVSMVSLFPWRDNEKFSLLGAATNAWVAKKRSMVRPRNCGDLWRVEMQLLHTPSQRNKPLQALLWSCLVIISSCLPSDHRFMCDFGWLTKWWSQICPCHTWPCFSAFLAI